jgi:hypothetical protein
MHDEHRHLRNIQVAATLDAPDANDSVLRADCEKSRGVLGLADGTRGPHTRSHVVVTDWSRMMRNRPTLASTGRMAQTTFAQLSGPAWH